jgi:hypothetical protein
MTTSVIIIGLLLVALLGLAVFVTSEVDDEMYRGRRR